MHDNTTAVALMFAAASLVAAASLAACCAIGIEHGIAKGVLAFGSTCLICGVAVAAVARIMYR